jgi:hypothetical protein
MRELMEELLYTGERALPPGVESVCALDIALVIPGVEELRLTSGHVSESSVPDDARLFIQMQHTPRFCAP